MRSVSWACLPLPDRAGHVGVEVGRPHPDRPSDAHRGQVAVGDELPRPRTALTSMETPAVGGTWSHGRQEQQQQRHRARQPAAVPTRSSRSGRSGWSWSRSTGATSASGIVTRIARPARHRPRVAPQVGRSRRRSTGVSGRAPRARRRRRIAELERENRELRRANEILEVGLGFLRGGARPPTATMTSYIDEHRDHLRGRADLPGPGDRPIHLLRRPSRPPSARAVRDEELRPEISAGPHRELRGLRRAQGLAPAAPRGRRGRP